MLHTHKTVLIIFPPNFQTITITLDVVKRKEGDITGAIYKLLQRSRADENY